MNPYETLGVSSQATNTEIKSAYRRLVKKYHPDVYKGNHEDMIRQLNAAYDILSDPARKMAFDGRGSKTTSFVYEYQEDPRTKQRREYAARRRAEIRRRKEEYFRIASNTYKVLRLMSWAGFALASLFVIDEHMPQVMYHEVAEKGWLDDSRRTDESVSYMQTENFLIAVPSRIHVFYDYDAIDRQVLAIAVSPIFEVPSTVSLVNDGENVTAEIKRTIFSSQINAQYLLFFVSLFIVIRKRYSDTNLGLAFIPIFVMVFIWLTYF
jgi:hypothetical protein